MSPLTSLEKFFGISACCIYFFSVLFFAYEQNDQLYIAYASVVFLFVVLLNYIVCFVLSYIPYIPRFFSSLYATIFLFTFVGIPILLSITLITLILSVYHLGKTYASHGITKSSVASLTVLAISLTTSYSFLFLNVDSRISESTTPKSSSQIKGVEYHTFTYGSGTDKYRNEYSTKIKIKTPPFDASHIITGWKGFSGWYRSFYWGFDESNLPLNARVWIPNGRGSFPLVLILHGDHAMQDYSDAGYSYLAEPLAKKGNIVISLDSNFLNRSWSDLMMTSGLYSRGDMPARSQLVIEHLKVLSKFNGDNQTPFFQKIDFSQVSLIGHSRGGEAVSHAPFLLQKENLTNINIQTIIAIAPVDSNYWPEGRRSQLLDTNYMLIHGSLDGEIPFYGRGQYSRTSIRKELRKMKIALYIEGANHGQFNSRWGKNDKAYGSPLARRWNLRDLIPTKTQEGIAKDAIFSFLQFSNQGNLEEDADYLVSTLKERWKPKTNIKTQYQIGSPTTLIDFESQQPSFKTSSLNTNVVEFVPEAHALHLSWKNCKESTEKTRCSIEYKLKESANSTFNQAYIDIANISDNAAEFSLELNFTDNSKQIFNANRIAPKTTRHLDKTDLLVRNKTSEVVFETYRFDIENEKTLNSLTLIFNDASEGNIYIDNISLY